VSGELEKLPLGKSDFGDIRRLPGVAYFDKTEYIPVLEKGPSVQLVCRPRRFGKSLTVSMLQYFHGFQFRTEYDQLFKIEARRTIPYGMYEGHACSKLLYVIMYPNNYRSIC
jgi:hypothetical protein